MIAILLGGMVLAVFLVLAGFAIATAIVARRVEARVPRAGRFVEVPGARLHYVDRGTGPAIVMIHGVAAQLHNFTYGLTDRLSDRYRVICVDRPGCGYSTLANRSQPGLYEQAAMIAHFLRALDLDRPLVVGHSLGGAVSLALALDHPSSVGALALLSPLTQRQDDVPEAFARLVIRSARLRWLFSRTLAVPLGKLGSRKVQAQVFAPDRCPADFESRGGNALLFRPNSVFAASSELSAGSGELIAMMARYPAVEAPLAILFARHDAILDPVVHGAAMTAAKPLATLDLIDGGHMFPITAPEQTAAWIDHQARKLADHSTQSKGQ